MAEPPMKTVPAIIQDFKDMIARDFSDVRQRFDTQIRKMEVEIAKFQCELQEKDGKIFSATKKSNKIEIINKPEESNVLSKTPSPILKKGRKKNMKLTFDDASKFSPKELDVSESDKKLNIRARPKQQLPNKSIFTESNREYGLQRSFKPRWIRPPLPSDLELIGDAAFVNLSSPSRFGASLVKK